MSEYSIHPHGKHYDSCILRGSCKSAFLHPEEEIDIGSDRSAAGLMSKMPPR
jgi:hypothetical protein